MRASVQTPWPDRHRTGDDLIAFTDVVLVTGDGRQRRRRESSGHVENVVVKGVSLGAQAPYHANSRAHTARPWQRLVHEASVGDVKPRREVRALVGGLHARRPPGHETETSGRLPMYRVPSYLVSF